MIKAIPYRVLSAKCDACGKSIYDKFSNNVNRGIMKNSFGYPSPLDNLIPINGTPESFDLCEKCWTKALKSVGLYSKIK